MPENVPYEPCEYKGKTVLVDRYVVLGAENCGETGYDAFDLNLSGFASEKMNAVSEFGFAGFQTFSRKSPHYMNELDGRFNLENKKVFLYAEVRSEKPERVVVQIIAGCNTKLWINGKCVSVHNYDWLHACYVTAELKRGRNSILIEMYSPAEGRLFSLQIRNFLLEQSEDVRALSNLGNAVVVDPLTLVSELTYIPSDSSFRFMFFKNRNTEFEDEFRIDILDSAYGFVKRQYGKLGMPVTVDMDELRKISTEVMRYEWIGCTFREKSGKEYVTAACVFPTDFREEALRMAEKALSLSERLSSELRFNVLGLVKKQRQILSYEDYGNAFWLTERIAEISKRMESDSYTDEIFYTPGKQEFFVRSELDDSIVRIQAYIPPYYDKNRSYPLVLALSTGNDGEFCGGPIEENISEPCLCFDVTGRGFTGGSYIGETSIAEILKWIKSRYIVDENRIYLLGQSNGGYASYAIAQNYPHFAAGVFPHISNPDFNNLKNLSNVPVYQTVSDADFVFTGHTNDVKRILGKYGNYTQYDFENMLHLNFAPYLYHKGILRSLLSNRKNPFPETVLFRTCRNRHAESFWIKLHGIRRGHTYAEVKGTAVSDRRIDITVKCANGLTVTLPPTIDRNNFTVRINKTEFNISDCKTDKIVFRKNREWIISDTEPVPDYRKGTGLLDVYLDSMRIVIPGNAPEALRNVAEHFSRPLTNGWNPVINVKYPIYEDVILTEEILSSHNLVLADLNNTNRAVDRIYDTLPIKYDITGYEYKGIRTETPYIILQVVPSPYDPKKTYLVVSANSEKLLNSFLVRRVVIPYYSSGIHPYWNSEAVIFDGKEYKRIYEHGNGIEKIG